MYEENDMNKTDKTLLSMCGYLASVQAEDGGFACEACGFEHGRADNAVFPFICCYSLTNDTVWLERVNRLLDFRKKLENDDGSVSNDFRSPWKGITAFSAIGLYKTLYYYDDILPDDLYDRIEECFVASARWVHENIKLGFRANINYYCASAAVNAMYGKMFSDDEYTRSAEELLGYCMGLFTRNGILRGEGQPHDFVTPNGCVPADIGYIVEESIPCLTDAAIALSNEKLLDKLAEYSVELLEFMLPDGAWDNSFGSRNNKWTYYGSRTATGCFGAFMSLSGYRAELAEAAWRNLELIEKCSRDGALFGGYEYDRYGQKPCVHHTFSHAVGLADAIASGFENERTGCELPCDNNKNRVLYFPEVNTYRIYCGKWIATVTGNDYGTYTRGNGAAHASGGALSMLYHRDCGPVIAGSVLEYKRTETNNMQIPTESVNHQSLLPGVEIVHDGKKYSTSLCSDCSIGVEESFDEDTKIAVNVSSYPESPEGDMIKKCGCAEIEYDFSDEEVGISLTLGDGYKGAEYILPVISGSGIVVDGDYTGKEPIFFLTCGFGADEYTFSSRKIKISLKNNCQKH